MSTTIDSLQIEIQSTSTNASQGIDALARALGRLKQNGSIGVAVKNLDRLKDTLINLKSASSNANKIRELALAMEKLKSVGHLSSLTSLTKLPEAFKGLSGIDTNSGAEKIRQLVEAVAPLTNIKVSGFNSLINSLLKLDKVVEALSDDKLEAFEERIRRIDSAITPLSAKMTSVSGGFKGLTTAARSSAGGVREVGTSLNTTSLNLSSFIFNLQAVYHALQRVSQSLARIIGQAIEWDGIAARFGRGFGASANETYAWVQKLNDEMGINIQQFMQYSSIYANMLTGFGVAMKDAHEMAVGYTELTYDIWAGYNDIYKTFADASEAVKSAIAGEVEPVRRAGFTIVESQLEQTAANYGLEISLEKATEAQKSYLRYLTLVDQAHAQNLIGSYARELNTAEGMVRTLSQQMKSLTQTFGSLFLPILVKVTPWLQAFVELLTDAVVAMAGFFGIDIQPVSWGKSIDNVAGSAVGATDAVEDTTKALKEMKNATIGIDELNVISPNTGGGSGSSAGGASGFEGLDIESIWDEAIFDQINSKVDELKSKIKDFYYEYENQIKILGALLGALSISGLLGHFGSAIGLGEKFLGLMGTISKLAVTGIVITLQYTLMTEFFGDYMQSKEFKDYLMALVTGAISTYILYSMWGKGGIIVGLGVTAIASISALIENGGITDAESAIVALTGLASAAGAVALGWGKLKPVIGWMKEYVAAAKQMTPEVGALAAWFPRLTSALAPVGGAIATAAKAIGGFVGGLSAGAIATIVAIIAALGSAVYFVYENWQELGTAVKNFFKNNISPKLDRIKKSWDKVKKVLEPLKPLFEKIAEKLQPIVDWCKKAADEVVKFFKSFDWMDGVKRALEVFGGVVFGILTGTISGAFSALVGVIEGAVHVFSGTVQIIGGIIDAIVKLFKGDFSGAYEACEDILMGIVELFVGLYDMTVGAVVNFVDGIIDWFRELWDVLVGHSIVPDTVNAIVDWFKSLPRLLGDAIKDFVNGIIDGFKDLAKGIKKKFEDAWETVLGWWKDVKDLDPVGIFVNLVKSGWSTIKGWIGNIPTLSQLIALAKDAWTSVKNWIGSLPVISQAIKLIKEGWSTIKSWIGNIPTLSQAIGLIKSGWTSIKSWIGNIPILSAGIQLVKNGWSTVKSWLGNLNFNLGFKLPKIGVNWGSKEVLGFKISFPTGFYTYAQGGFPDMGELFVAREAGPEMVGRIGSKTTVANNDQIVEGISAGVYQAVMAAMKAGGNNGTQKVEVYLDGRQITSTVEQRQRERGAKIMGSEVYAY